MIDIASVRRDTPGCEQRIHFNNAGASLMPEPVYRAVTAHLRRERDIGGYEAQTMAADDLAAFYTEFAGLLRCQPEQIAYLENATRAWDMAFYSLPLEPGDRILTHETEYASNYLAMLQLVRRKGLRIDVAPSDASGQLDVDAMERMIGPETRVIAITHVPTQGGVVNPAENVGELARRHDLIYLLDACQSAGQIDLDIGQLRCDMLSGTGRKFLRGPRGTGFLYVSDRIVDRLDPAFIDLHAATWTAADDYRLAPGARRFETWESNVAGKIGLTAAVRYARDLGLPAIESRVSELAAALRAALKDVAGVTVHDRGTRQSGIVTFRIDGEDPQTTAARLHNNGINVSVAVRTSAQLDFGARNLDSLLRASVHYYNSDHEIERLVQAVKPGPNPGPVPNPAARSRPRPAPPSAPDAGATP